MCRYLESLINFKYFFLQRYFKIKFLVYLKWFNCFFVLMIELKFMKGFYEEDVEFYFLGLWVVE